MKVTACSMPARSVTALFVAAVLVAAGVTTHAQNRQRPPEPDGTTVGRIGSGEQPTFRAGVTLVTTDVIVRDRSGLFVPDLTREDFRVFEDAVEQDIVSMVLVHGGRVFNQLQAPAPVQEGIILPSSRPRNDTAGRIFILFVDDLHLTTSLTPKIRQVFEDLTDTLIHEGDLFGIISTGPSSLSIDMTYDRELLKDAGNRIMGDALSVRDQINGMETSRGPSEILYRAHVAFKTARGVLRNLEQVNDRRKVFIYLSEGYDFNPFPESRMFSGLLAGQRQDAAENWDSDSFNNVYGGMPHPREDPFGNYDRQGQVFADGDLSIELAELARAANRANTSFYTVDPRGLIASPDLDIEVPIEEWQMHTWKTQNTLRMLAELTGGRAVVNRNDFEGAMREIDAETSDYYVVGFYTSNPDPTIRTRRLRVEVDDGSGWDVRARTHYTLPRNPF